MKDFVVEIADELDGFIIVTAHNEDEAESIAWELGYSVLYAHFEYDI